MKKKINGAIEFLFEALRGNWQIVFWFNQITHILLSLLVFWLGYKLSPNPLSLLGFVVIYEPTAALSFALLYYFFGGMITIFLVGDIPMFLLGFVYSITEDSLDDFTIEKIKMEKLPPNKKPSH